MTKIASPKPKTANQKKLIKAIQDHDIVFCNGPAGTGKTHLCVGQAMHYLNTNQISKVVVTRPAVEAGESLGFLPGDLSEKMDPYMQPIWDELSYFLEVAELREYLNTRIIEICPIAYMRGRTLNDCFIICDEAQNVNKKQMEMLLTRLGQNSKMVLNGDIKQTDLKDMHAGAFIFAQQVFENVDEIGIINLTPQDNQRHPLVSKIVKIWEENT